MHYDLTITLMDLATHELQDFARAWLTGVDIEPPGKAALGVLRSALPPRKALEGLSWLMGLGGPTLCALDQVDAIVSVASCQSAGRFGETFNVLAGAFHARPKRPRTTGEMTMAEDQS